MPANRSPQESLERFKGEYGRLCVLMATAVTDDQSRDLIVEAARGAGEQSGPIFVKLRNQRTRVNAALDGCRDTVNIAEIVTAGREVKAAVESEWIVSIPMFAEVSGG